MTIYNHPDPSLILPCPFFHMLSYAEETYSLLVQSATRSQHSKRLDARPVDLDAAGAEAGELLEEGLRGVNGPLAAATTLVPDLGRGRLPVAGDGDGLSTDGIGIGVTSGGEVSLVDCDGVVTVLNGVTTGAHATGEIVVGHIAMMGCHLAGDGNGSGCEGNKSGGMHCEGCEGRRLGDLCHRRRCRRESNFQLHKDKG